MSHIVYWIEDEPENLETISEELGEKKCVIASLGTIDDVLTKLDDIERNPGVILLDLYLPQYHSPDKGLISGPETGLYLLEVLQRKLPSEYPIIILSGNVTLGVRMRLMNEYRIAEENLFDKPLLPGEQDRLVWHAANQARLTARPAAD